MTEHTHVIPVPDGMGILDAWAEIQIFGELWGGRTVEEDGTGGKWVVVHCDGSCAKGVIGSAERG